MTINIPEPQNCKDCPCSCVVPHIPDISVNTYQGEKPYYEILCRIDYKTHKPFDENCVLQK